MFSSSQENSSLLYILRRKRLCLVLRKQNFEFTQQKRDSFVLIYADRSFVFKREHLATFQSHKLLVIQSWNLDLETKRSAWPQFKLTPA